MAPEFLRFLLVIVLACACVLLAAAAIAPAIPRGILERGFASR